MTSLDVGIEAGQSARAASWRSDAGLELIRSFNGGENSAVLASWLAATFPNLYGTNAGAHNLTGKTNADVVAFFVSLFDQPASQLDAVVLTTALNVYATTLSLGGTLGQSYGFAASDTGLGARSYNVGPDGAPSAWRMIPR